MRLLPIIISVVLLSSFSFTDSLYNYSFASIDGTTHLFNEYQGKKIWIVILPSSQTADDSAFLIRVDSIAQSNESQLITIAVPSYEDGYTTDTLNALPPWYQSIISNSVILTQGMYTHKSSGTLQNPLFSWLTTTTLNNHFEEEVGGPGEMYFINEQGELNGVFGPEVKWSNKIVNRMLQ